MPPSGFNKPAVRGLLQFLNACYVDLLKEVQSGKHKDFPSAIRHERRQIGKALRQLHINKTGRLVRRIHPEGR
ncbi:hypothetical protein HYV30_02355 [Candidatus Kaiserbacteria bacterium]|nr:hypothetical protein [Candidatus Kaiserbacteria bacterium]